MAHTVGIGIQDFAKIRTNNYFYIDKTKFIKEWWKNGDDVTLITRPRRFGKTLNMSMLEYFFSVDYAGRGDLFEGMFIWKEEKYRELQGTFPVINLSFAGIKEKTYEDCIKKINQMLSDLYSQYDFLKDSGKLADSEIDFFLRVQNSIGYVEAALSIHHLSDYLSRYYDKKVIILLDEYDTPMQEAYVNGYWDELSDFTRSLFNSTFKTNPYMERGIMTGITRVSKESIFSDLNNLEVITTTSDKYADAFGFTEAEVFAAMDDFGYLEKEEVKSWYDGFSFGQFKDIYNPWSILNYLDKHRLSVYWANTSSNSLVGSLLRAGNRTIKQQFEQLMNGGVVSIELDEQIVYNQLDQDESAIWSLLLASGYLRVAEYAAGRNSYGEWEETYALTLTNYEVVLMFRRMVRGWFAAAGNDYNEFVKALLADDVETMNVYMNHIAQETFSFFDTEKRRTEPERFYHGFVLGLIAELAGRYVITSNRESGMGRYDVMLKPATKADNAVIMEFKIHNPAKEADLEETVKAALAQIEQKNYQASLTAEGIDAERIRKYGFAFEGKKVFIG